jgi:chemotaxis protein histidine kinase CheA
VLDRAKRLAILVESNRRSLESIDTALESLEEGLTQRSQYSKMQRGFHTIKHDALHLQLTQLARLAGAAESIVQRAADQKLGLPLDLLRSASNEIRAATETVATGGRHRLNRGLLKSLDQAARSLRAD